MKNSGVKFLTIVIFVVSLAVYFFHLNRPPQLIWDEALHVPPAKGYLLGKEGGRFDSRTPPLGKEMISLSIRIFGDNFFAYRFPSALAGTMTATLLFMVGLQFTGKILGGFLAWGLWLTSTLAYLHARLGMLDMMLTFFFFAGIVAFLQLIRTRTADNISFTSTSPTVLFSDIHDIRLAPRPSFLASRSLWIYLACLFAAIAGMIKVLGFVLFPLYLLGLILFRRQWPLRQSLPHFFLGTFLFIPAVTLISYGILGVSLFDIPRLWGKMYRLQVWQHQDFAGLSHWYEWFIFKGGLWYRSEALPTGAHYSLWATNNPVLWIAGAFAMVLLLYFSWREKNTLYLILFLSIPIQIFFWILMKSQTILTYALPMEPIFCLAVTLILSEVSKKVSRSKLFFTSWSLLLLAGSLFYFLKNFWIISG